MPAMTATQNIVPRQDLGARSGAPRPAARQILDTVYLPPADRHLHVEGARLRRLDASEPIGMQRPSGTILYRSMARSLGAGGLGVLLTVMGDDGAEGLRELRQAGGYTVAEDVSTAVVYGMPAVALRLGAVCESLPLAEIGPRVVSLVSRER